MLRGNSRPQRLGELLGIVVCRAHRLDHGCGHAAGWTMRVVVAIEPDWKAQRLSFAGRRATGGAQRSSGQRTDRDGNGRARGRVTKEITPRDAHRSPYWTTNVTLTERTMLPLVPLTVSV